MSIKFAALLAEDRRLTILVLLLNSPSYAASQYLLHSALPNFGHNIGMDQLRGDIHWLEEQLLIDKTVIGDVYIGRLTNRGVDVAQGRVEHPGVKRPMPE